MDIRRAKQILSSSNEVKVHYQGTEIWIDSCDEQGDMCTVHLKGSEHEKNIVPVAELEEI